MRSVRGPSEVGKITGCPIGFIWLCIARAQHKTCATIREVIGELGADKIIWLKQAHVLQIPRNAVELVKPHENIKHTFHKLIKQHQQKSFIIGLYEKASHPWRRLRREPDGARRLMKETGSSGKPHGSLMAIPDQPGPLAALEKSMCQDVQYLYISFYHMFESVFCPVQEQVVILQECPYGLCLE